MIKVAKVIKNTVKFVLGIGIATLTVAGLSGCSVSVDGEDYRSVSPVFDIEQFFDGNVKAWGHCSEPLGRGGAKVRSRHRWFSRWRYVNP
ncbi:hypothetical protein ALT717_20140 [Alteromonas macleodii]